MRAEVSLTEHDHREIRYIRQLLTQTVDYLGQLVQKAATT